MAKQKQQRKASGGMRIPLLVVAGMAPVIGGAWTVRGGGVGRMGQELLKVTGYEADKNIWSASSFKNYGMPIILGVVAHKVANRLGINRMLKKAGVPFVSL
jgi:hypothetical protein